jgi:POT family proton-dependent oligopeptide transporter
MSNTASTVLDFQSAPVNAKGQPTAELANPALHDDKKYDMEDITVQVGGAHEIDTELVPTEEDLLTLRKVAAPLP